ncbi:VOC family protein [Phenylobacterium sp. 58.2.17]|uniref:VOC family protein n=1 Tax=Phenylobacterium sp. 58.2.17 TaxID=2969306 RepID=UPI002264A720|nr:VOC family protein [Phenylobacterium sp. 58.2.17]MCX7588553.1 VOC family protein [Phenylobacterium sp. 58.2.17]
MDQRLSLITLGVDDLARSRAFFERGLGWSPSTIAEGVCFYQLPGIGLALFGRDDLAEDARRPLDGRFSGITLAINERSRQEVDATFAQALAAGATPLKPPEEVFWGGYSGYFADLDGHTWEVAHNPGCTIHAEGATTFAAS